MCMSIFTSKGKNRLLVLPHYLAINKSIRKKNNTDVKKGKDYKYTYTYN